MHTEDTLHYFDHGYLKLIETWGSDERIIESARMSTNKGFQGWDPFCPSCGFSKECGEHDGGCADADNPNVPWVGGDMKLLRYLWKKKHHTPFEMAGVTFEVQAPIFVFREWHRHRVPFGYNELSGRYSQIPDLNYLPTKERLLTASEEARKGNKQSGTVAGAPPLTVVDAAWFREEVRELYFAQQKLYEEALNRGVTKELARIILPLGRYSRMRATGNLRGWLAFLALRNAPDAQREIRTYAEGVEFFLKQKFPRTMEVRAEA